MPTEFFGALRIGSQENNVNATETDQMIYRHRFRLPELAENMTTAFGLTASNLRCFFFEGSDGKPPPARAGKTPHSSFLIQRVILLP
jgi:hypothetical protein